MLTLRYNNLRALPLKELEVIVRDGRDGAAASTPALAGAHGVVEVLVVEVAAFVVRGFVAIFLIDGTEPRGVQSTLMKLLVLLLLLLQPTAKQEVPVDIVGSRVKADPRILRVIETLISPDQISRELSLLVSARRRIIESPIFTGFHSQRASDLSPASTDSVYNALLSDLVQALCELSLRRVLELNEIFHVLTENVGTADLPTMSELKIIVVAHELLGEEMLAGAGYVFRCLRVTMVVIMTGLEGRAREGRQLGR